jgi:hypothetical protein
MIRGGVPIARPTRPVTEADRRTRRAPGGSARRLLSTLAFRNDQYLWWQMAEYGYDTYLIRAAPKPCETARFETGLRVQVAIPAATTCLSAIGREKLEAISLPPGSTHCPYQDLAGRVDHTSTHSIPSHPLRHVHMHGRSPITFGAGAFVGFGGPRRLAVTLRGNLAGPEHVCSAPIHAPSWSDQHPGTALRAPTAIGCATMPARPRATRRRSGYQMSSGLGACSKPPSEAPRKRSTRLDQSVQQRVPQSTPPFSTASPIADIHSKAR